MPSTMNYFQSYDILQSRSLWIFIGFILSTLLSFMPSFDALGWTSSLSVIFILIVTVIVVLYAHPEVSSLNPCPESASSNINHDSRQDCQGSTASNVFTLHAIKFIPVFLFSFTCHQNIFNVINELASPTIFRIDMIIVASMGTVLAVYLTVCTAVYMTYGDKTKSNLLNNYPGQ
jgi:amino acid permease